MQFGHCLASTAALLSAVGASTGPLAKRQSACSDIDHYFTLVNTALFTVNYIQIFQPPCSLDLVSVFDARALDGLYAVELICLYDSGVKLFENTPLSIVNDDLIVALIGLFDAASDNDDPSRTLSCVNMNTTILDEAGLPSSEIKDSVCNPIPCSSNPASSVSSMIPSASSISRSAQPSVSVSNPSRSSSSSSASSSGATGSLRSSSVSTPTLSSPCRPSKYY